MAVWAVGGGCVFPRPTPDLRAEQVESVPESVAAAPSAPPSSQQEVAAADQVEPSLCGERPGWLSTGVFAGLATEVDGSWFFEAHETGVVLRGPGATDSVLLWPKPFRRDAVFDAANGLLWVHGGSRISVIDLALPASDAGREIELLRVPESLATRPFAFGVRYMTEDGLSCTMGTDKLEGASERVVIEVDEHGRVEVEARLQRRSLREASLELDRSLVRPACTTTQGFDPNDGVGTRMSLGSLPFELEIVGLGRRYALCMLRDSRADIYALLISGLKWAPLEDFEDWSATQCLTTTAVLSENGRALGFVRTICVESGCEELEGNFLGFACGQVLVGRHDGL